MKTDLDYKAIPRGFVHCFNERCPKADACLRHLAAQRCTAEIPFVTVVNPMRVLAADARCPHFKTVEKIRVAWGIKSLFDKLPHKVATGVRSQVISYFGKTQYYRIYRKERIISPEGQRNISLIFSRYGIAEAPEYDSYSEVYRW